jgi:hypothetical protein
MAPSDSADWRIQGQERYLTGAVLTLRPYRRYSENPDWDHDHCEFCWAKFMVEDLPEVLHEGYCTLDEYRWICSTCFADFRERFVWTVVPMDRHERAKQIQADIRQVLLRDWDPIGVGDLPEAQDEYDSYVGQVYGLLASGASDAALVDRLQQIEVVNMGLSRPESTRLQSVARKLRTLDVRL